MVLTALLIVDMVRRIRRVRYRAQVEAERAAAAEAGTQPTAQSSAPARRPRGTDPRRPAGLPVRKSTVMQDPETADRGSPDPQPGGLERPGAEPSAYFRQHAGNPVHWRPFGDAAFAAAAARDVPVFLSIGYAACHWCHVMADESFEDQDTAEYLNAHFVAVKVDREERPDVDAVYMAATQAISGEGGWPMSVFLLPDGRAFHAGTYYPPRPMPGRPSFRQVLEAVAEAWTERRGAVEANAAALASGIAASAPAAAVRFDGPPQPLDAALLGAAVGALSRSEDQVHGGFGGAPKFPPSAVLEFLIRHAAATSGPHADADAGPSDARDEDSGEADTAAAARDMAGRTLAAMSRSALFDQLDGGFARYSVTGGLVRAAFRENALRQRPAAARLRPLGPARGHTGVPGGRGRRRRRADGRLAPRPPRAAGRPASEAPAGTPELHRAHAEHIPGVVALASSLDADTVVDGVHAEGATYLWTPAGLQELLGPGDGAAVADLMNVRTPGSVTVDGSPLHPGTEISGGDAELWGRVRPVLARRAPDARSRAGTRRWWPAGTDWPSLHSPTPGPYWGGRSLWTPRSGSPRISNACTGSCPATAPAG